jgi:hypothetical protein
LAAACSKQAKQQSNKASTSDEPRSLRESRDALRAGTGRARQHLVQRCALVEMLLTGCSIISYCCRGIVCSLGFIRRSQQSLTCSAFSSAHFTHP